MAYSFQTFSVGQVLTAAQVNQIEVNVRDHVHGVGGVVSIGHLFSAGTGTATSGPMGSVDSQTSAAGIGNGADATDDTLFTYSLPLNSLSANGKSVFVRASGKTATNANLKTIKLFFAGTDFQTLPQGAYSGAGWVLEYEITRVDSTHVNIVATAYLGTADFKITLFNNSAVADLTANASIIKATGASASSAANDILGYSMTVTFSN